MSKPYGAGARLPGAPVVSRSQLAANRIPGTTIDRWLQQGHLVRSAAEGVYKVNGQPDSARLAYQVMALKTPGGVFCLLSALYIHKLTTAAPARVWFAIDRSAREPEVGSIPVEFVRMSAESLTHGAVPADVDGVTVRVASIAKTTCDCLKFSDRVGLDVALESLRLARQVFGVSAEELMECANACRVARPMQHYLAALV